MPHGLSSDVSLSHAVVVVQHLAAKHLPAPLLPLS
jgi:hypothetical protein